MNPLTDLARGDLITVTYDDGTTVRTWHGQFTGVLHVLSTHRPQMPAPLDHTHAFLHASHEGIGMRDWIRLNPAGHYLLDGQDIAATGPDHSFDPNGGSLGIDPAADGVTVEPITAAGQQSLHLHEHPFMLRKYALAKVAQADGDLAALIDRVIDVLVAEAREEAAAEALRHGAD